MFLILRLKDYSLDASEFALANICMYIYVYVSNMIGDERYLIKWRVNVMSYGGYYTFNMNLIQSKVTRKKVFEFPLHSFWLMDFKERKYIEPFTERFIKLEVVYK